MCLLKYISKLYSIYLVGTTNGPTTRHFAYFLYRNHGDGRICIHFLANYNSQEYKIIILKLAIWLSVTAIF